MQVFENLKAIKANTKQVESLMKRNNDTDLSGA